MRILYLSQYFPPEMGAPSARVYELSRHWVKHGDKVTVLTSFPNHPTGVIPPEYRGYRFMEEEKDGIRIVRTYIFAAPNRGFFKRVLSYISFMFSSVIQGTRKVGKQDVLIATSPQFFVGIAGYFISRLKGIPFIFEVRDLWPESIVQLGQLKNRWLIRFLEWIEMTLYRKAIHIVGVADSTVDILTARGVPAEKITIIKNGVDLELFHGNGDSGALKEKYGFGGRFIVSYIGTHGLSHALDRVLDTANLLKDERDILFLLVGEGAEKENLIKKARELNLHNVKFLDQIDKKQLPDFYGLSDIILVTLRDLPLFRSVIPSKIFEIMAMARPIIISVDGESRRLVEEAGAGVFSQPEDASMLKEKILDLKNNAQWRKQLGANGRKFVEEHFDRNKLAAQYQRLLHRLIKHGTNNA
ncbi:glycosyltransferase family 4 protein [Caldithrix abyssi]